MHLLSKIGYTCYYFDTCFWNYLQGCIHYFLSYYTCFHTCIHDILFPDQAYRIDRGETLLEFNEEEEGDQQEIPQATTPKDEEKNPEELLECPDHRPKPRSILSLPVFYKILL